MNQYGDPFTLIIVTISKSFYKSERKYFEKPFWSHDETGNDFFTIV